ncbi:MAG TPA: TatD family hydrolase [Candidatus Absconditabacterales bacterium]|nr:TatD family hydrolase [Candidatus Absconditabacterales bacterium]
MYFDSHTHLNDDKLFSQWQSYLGRFIEAGGAGLVNIGLDELHNQRAIEISQQAEQKKCLVKATIGYHPSEACFHNITEDNLTEKISDLVKLYNSAPEAIVGIGECGIDLHYESGKETLDIQKKLFSLQCDLAQELNLPIIIHSRDDFQSTRDIIQNYKFLKVYFHCRGYGPEELKKLVDFFPKFWVGFCGNTTYPKAELLRESLKVAPLKCILLETDAPYLAPQEFRGQQNEPALIPSLYRFVAGFLGKSEDELQKIVAENWKGCYGL